MYFDKEQRKKKKKVKHIENHRWKRDKTKISKRSFVGETEEEHKKRIDKLKSLEKRRKPRRKTDKTFLYH